MTKVIAFVAKCPDLAREELVKRQTEDHVKLLKDLGASSCRINIAVELQHDGSTHSHVELGAHDE